MYGTLEGYGREYPTDPHPAHTIWEPMSAGGDGSFVLDPADPVNAGAYNQFWSWDQSERASGRTGALAPNGWDALEGWGPDSLGFDPLGWPMSIALPSRGTSVVRAPQGGGGPRPPASAPADALTPSAAASVVGPSNPDPGPTGDYLTPVVASPNTPPPTTPTTTDGIATQATTAAASVPTWAWAVAAGLGAFLLLRRPHRGG